MNGDIKKFFVSIDHNILTKILVNYIPDKNILRLIEKVINSFLSTRPGVGLPLGNLTSQLLVNIYMNEFDQFMKHKLKAKYYIRYADDFVILSDSKTSLINLIKQIREFLQESLKLKLHPKKISISTIASGVDFLGWVQFPDHRALRSSTKRRMFKKLKKNANLAIQNSYLGMLKHGNARNLAKSVTVE